MPPESYPDAPIQLPSVTGGIVVIGHGARPLFVLEGQPISLPGRADLLAYVAALQRDRIYQRWADHPAADAAADDRTEAVHDASDEDEIYIDLKGRLPMRVSPVSSQPGATPGPAQELVAALAGASGAVRRTVILGEPGSGKSTALERLAWVSATETLAAQAAAPESALAPHLRLPILVRLTDYQGEPDLYDLVQKAFNRHCGESGGSSVVLESATAARLLLRAKDWEVLLLLDGLNELRPAHLEAGRAALRRLLDDCPQLTVHVTCRTADFDRSDESDPTTASAVPGAQLWEVQPLSDEIRYWGDREGQSDVRDYLAACLGQDAGERLYVRLHADERLRGLARLPLFLKMLKDVGGDGALPANRGDLVRDFVRSPRVLGKIKDLTLRERAERCLEALGWRMQQAGSLEVEIDDLYEALASVPGVDAASLRPQLHGSGLLVTTHDAEAKSDRIKFLHQLFQEYCAAAYLARQPDCQPRLTSLAQVEWWRETAIVALWLDRRLHSAAFLLGLMQTSAVDLRVRVAAADLLAQVGDPRFPQQTGLLHSPDPAAPGRLVERRVAYIEPEMVTIPAGVAQLGGADLDADDDELPGCSVPVARFALAVHPVTNAEFRLFMAAGGYEDATLWTAAGQAWLDGKATVDPETAENARQVYELLTDDVEGVIAALRRTQSLSDEMADTYRTLATWSEADFVQWYAGGVSERRRQPALWGDGRFNRDTQPVVGVTWWEAMAYAAWLSRLTGKAYRLPSEAEWEWAARRNQRRYPWGDGWDAALCNSSASRLDAPAPVGVYAHGATPDGLHDLAGNVYEWTLSLYRPYPYVADDGREDPAAAGWRVIRGGSWYTDHTLVRCGRRDWSYPRSRLIDLGVRLARGFS